jgi:putative MATE family efflux protein
MFARQLYRVADVAMVGLAVGPAAIAGLAFASIYWGFANAFSLGLAGVTISQVSQRYGVGEYHQLATVVKQTLIIGASLMVPFIAVYWLYSNFFIGLVAGDAASIRYGTTYLKFLSLALVFNTANHVFSRTLAGADDTVIAMSLRATGAFVNIVLNAFFIFGLGMGVEGAAIGTILAEGVVSGGFAWGFITGRLPLLGEFPVTVPLGRPYFDIVTVRQLVRISPPLIVERLVRSFARFPLFVVLAVFGPIVVAAFEVARRIRTLVGATGSGFSMAGSSLVGQALGKRAELEADRYALDLLRFSVVIYVIAAGVIVLFAEPLAYFFAEDQSAVSQTIPFIRVAGISFVADGLSRSFSGILKGAGDNQWILYGRLVSQYVVLIPIVYLATIVPIGIVGVFVAMIAETGTRALITGYRYATGTWKVVSRNHRPSTVDE